MLITLSQKISPHIKFKLYDKFSQNKSLGMLGFFARLTKVMVGSATVAKKAKVYKVSLVWKLVLDSRPIHIFKLGRNMLKH